MRRFYYILLVIAVICLGDVAVDDFTRISVDPFVEGVGGAFVGRSFTFNELSSSNYNPALLSGEKSIFLSHSSIFNNLYIADFVAYNTSISQKIHFGTSFLVAGGDGLFVTAVPNEQDTLSSHNRPYIVAEKSHYDFILNTSASYSLGDRTSVGLTMKGFYRKLIDENAFGGGLSAGLSHQLGNNLGLGLFVRNISTMPVVWSTETTELALPSVRIGGTWHIFQIDAVSVEMAADGEYSIGDELFDYGGGIRARLMDDFMLSVGYSDIGFSAGASASFNNLGVSASFSNQSELDNSYRIALFYKWGK